MRVFKRHHETWVILTGFGKKHQKMDKNIDLWSGLRQDSEAERPVKIRVVIILLIKRVNTL